MVTEPAKDLLSDPDYFFCERLSCTLRKEVCLKRQESRAGRWGSREGYIPFEECMNCEQGVKIKHELVSPAKKFSQYPRERKGDRMKENTKCICHECGKEFEPYKNGRRTVSSICKECLNAKKIKTRGSLSLSIDFSEYSDLYQYLIKRAKENFRSPEMEVLAILDQLKGNGVQEGNVR